MVTIGSPRMARYANPDPIMEHVPRFDSCVTLRPRFASGTRALAVTPACGPPPPHTLECPPNEPPAKTREIYVPVSDLKVLLESEPHRVLLTRQEYDELVKKAKKAPETHVPHPTVIVSSDYDITVEEGRAKLHGTIAIDVLDDGLHAVPLDFGGVGLLAAKLDDQPAPIGYAADGRLNLLVSGQGRHRLALDMVAPLEMNSAQQYLSFRLTNAAVGRWRLSVPGDVEIKGGADVVSRSRWMRRPRSPASSCCPARGDCTILMSLNSHLQRREQAVASRCVLFDEVTEAYEKLHATVTFWILHRAVDRFRFVVPQGFEITEINSPLLGPLGHRDRGRPQDRQRAAPRADDRHRRAFRGRHQDAQPVEAVADAAAGTAGRGRPGHGPGALGRRRTEGRIACRRRPDPGRYGGPRHGPAGDARAAGARRGPAALYRRLLRPARRLRVEGRFQPHARRRWP